MKKGFGLLRQVNGPVESGVQTSAPKRRWPRRKVRRASVCPGLSGCPPLRPVDGPGFRSFRRWNRAERGDGVRIDPIGRKRAASRTAPRCPRTASFIFSGVHERAAANRRGRHGKRRAPWFAGRSARAVSSMQPPPSSRSLRGIGIPTGSARLALPAPSSAPPSGRPRPRGDAIAVSRTGHELRACPAGDIAPSIRVTRVRCGRRLLSGVPVPRSARHDGTGAIRPALRYDAFRPRGLGLFFPRGS